jgi:endonuclease/exonuclease/phosphatase family metal-dependent hydrolase
MISMVYRINAESANLPTVLEKPLSQITLATFNMLNLADAGFQFYPNADPYTAQEYAAKIAWTAAQLDTLRADVVLCQEVFSLKALQDCVDASTTMRGATVQAPHTDVVNQRGEKLPRLAIISRLPVTEWHSHTDLPEIAQITLPDGTKHTQFSRPVFEALVDVQGQLLRLFTVHLKSKRPDWAEGANEADPRAHTQAQLQSLLKRAGEAAGVRELLVSRLWHTGEPVVIMGDFNDTLQSPTTQLIAATRWKSRERSARDAMLYDAWDVSAHHDLSRNGPMRRDVSYTHIHEGVAEVIDQCLVSEEFATFSRHQIGYVQRVDIFNDHLNQRLRGVLGSKTAMSDHGQICVQLTFFDKPAQPAAPIEAVSP